VEGTLLMRRTASTLTLTPATIGATVLALILVLYGCQNDSGSGDDPCADETCSAHGICVVADGEPICACNAGYHDVGLTCVEDNVANPCEGVTCSGHGDCEENGDGVAACSCEEGYHAEGLACVENGVSPCASHEECRIQPYVDNPWFWQYEGVAVLLVGATDDDNIFQMESLEQHLDELASVGGNYVRNTMSSRDDGNLHPFADAGGGVYDLSLWNDAYWTRFDDLLSLTNDRNIIVQIEVWDRFDHSRDPWLSDPYNPDNNINYNASESGLAATYPNHPGQNEQPFFHTVPDMDDNTVVRVFQEAFVDKMLSYTFQYDHVLYVMDNETDEDFAWGSYWAGYLRSAAQSAGVGVETTEMWDDRNITTSDQHQYTWDSRDLFSFTDISQNNHEVGQTHWDQIQFVRDYLLSAPMPMNAVKIYGADSGSYGTDADAAERFWRDLLGGMASSRFHRPDAGLGLSEITKTQLRAARMVESKTLFFGLLAAQGLLSERSDNEAYACASPGFAYVVYLTGDGAVKLDLSDQTGPFELSWLNLQDATWFPSETIDAPAEVDLQAPWTGGSVAVIVRN